MSDTYATSLEGIRAAELRINAAARNIALGRSGRQPAESPAPSDLVQLSSAGPVTGATTSSPVDYAAELVTIIEARIGLEANLKVTASQQQLDRSTLDLLA